MNMEYVIAGFTLLAIVVAGLYATGVIRIEFKFERKDES